MARRPYFTEHSNEESHLRFKAAVESLGQRTDPRTDRMNNVKVDGIRLGDRVHEMRKPGRTFYEKSYAEANAVASLLVRLGMDDLGPDVRRHVPPEPDIEVVFADAPAIYIEQTMVMDDDARKLSNAIDEINFTARQDTNPYTQAAFNAGLLSLRIERLTPAHYEAGLPVAEIAGEVCALARTLDDDVSRLQPDSSAYPLLHSLGARGAYRRGLKTGSPIQLLMDHGRPEVVEAALRRQIQKKITKAAGYPTDSRPLWLLLDIDSHFGLASFAALARAVIADENPTCFDRIIVQHMYVDPIIIEMNRKP